MITMKKPMLGKDSGRLSQQTGLLGENIIINKLITIGYELFKPIVDMRGCDLLVRNNKGAYIRLQIKTSNVEYHSGNIEKLYYMFRFKKRQAFANTYNFDYCVCVCLTNEQIYIIPRKEIMKQETLCLSPRGKFAKYLNQFDLINEKEITTKKEVDLNE